MASWEPCALCRMGGHRECCICCNDAIAAEYRREQLELERIEAQRRIREQESLEEERKRRRIRKEEMQGRHPVWAVLLALAGLFCILTAVGVFRSAHEPHYNLNWYFIPAAVFLLAALYFSRRHPGRGGRRKGPSDYEWD